MIFIYQTNTRLPISGSAQTWPCIDGDVYVGGLYSLNSVLQDTLSSGTGNLSTEDLGYNRERHLK